MSETPRTDAALIVKRLLGDIVALRAELARVTAELAKEKEAAQRHFALWQETSALAARLAQEQQPSATLAALSDAAILYGDACGVTNERALLQAALAHHRASKGETT